jgi:HK97 family phage prohead protease
MEERFSLVSGEIRSAGGTSIIGTIAYNRLSKALGKNSSEFRERIRPGAFAGALSNQELKLLWQHDTSMPLASTAGGTLRVVDSPKALTIIGHLNPSITYRYKALL